MITMIFLSLSAARHGVESCSAILLWRASCSRRSDSSSCENLNPCAASAGSDATWTSNTRVARANRGRIGSKGRVLQGQRASTSPGRLAEREPEIYRTIRQAQPETKRPAGRRHEAPERVPTTCPALSGGHVLLEEGDRARPGKLGRSLVIAGRGVVMEAVVGVRIHVHLIFDAGGLECLFIIRPAGIDTLVERGVVKQERSFDLRRIGGPGRRAVERHGRGEIRGPHCHGVDDASAEAKPDRADLAVTFRTRLQEGDGGKQVLGALGRIELAE